MRDTCKGWVEGGVEELGAGRSGSNGFLRRSGGCFAAGAALLLSLGCEVTNPGPVQDEFLNDPASHQGMVDGAQFNLARALKNLAYDGALPTREIFPTGQIGAHGHSVITQGGHFPYDVTEFNNRWNWSQQARFVAENALTRFIQEEALPPSEHGSNRLIADAHLWAGYAYRVLGEHYCDAVVDGSGLLPGQQWFERAEQQFTSAIQVAGSGGHTATRLAATAGRAQARVWLGNWAGAVSDAQQISDDFVHVVAMDGDPAGARNRIWFASVDLPYRTLTAWNSWAYNHHLETGDPRVRGDDWNMPSTGALQGFGQVPFVQQRKYTSGDSDIRLASGADMRLIEAEALLVQGNWQAAMDLINQVRTRNISDSTGEPLQPWSAGSLEEAWSYLKRERYLELWLEGRRFGDLRRWEDQGAPGAVDWMDYESMAPLFSQNPRSRCLPVPPNELQSNPEIDAQLVFQGLPWYAPIGAVPGS
jgi:starch-binding outer membrane protein, SusD/RagB family